MRFLVGQRIPVDSGFCLFRARKKRFKEFASNTTKEMKQQSLDLFFKSQDKKRKRQDEESSQSKKKLRIERSPSKDVKQEKIVNFFNKEKLEKSDIKTDKKQIKKVLKKKVEEEVDEDEEEEEEMDVEFDEEPEENEEKSQKSPDSEDSSSSEDDKKPKTEDNESESRKAKFNFFNLSASNSKSPSKNPKEFIAKSPKKVENTVSKSPSKTRKQEEEVFSSKSPKKAESISKSPIKVKKEEEIFPSNSKSPLKAKKEEDISPKPSISSSLSAKSPISKSPTKFITSDDFFSKSPRKSLEKKELTPKKSPNKSPLSLKEKEKRIDEEIVKIAHSPRKLTKTIDSDGEDEEEIEKEEQKTQKQDKKIVQKAVAKEDSEDEIEEKPKTQKKLSKKEIKTEKEEKDEKEEVKPEKDEDNEDDQSEIDENEENGDLSEIDENEEESDSGKEDEEEEKVEKKEKSRKPAKKPTKPAKGAPTYQYSKYDPSKFTQFKRNEAVPFSFFAETLLQLEGTQSRIRKTEILGNFYRTVLYYSPKCISDAVYLTINKLGPSYEGLETGVGDGTLQKAVAGATGRTIANVRTLAQQNGNDLGLVAKMCKSSQKIMFKPKPLTMPFVFSALREIGMTSGKKSQDFKTKKIHSLITASQGDETQYVVRSLQGKLRIGTGEETVISALSHAIHLCYHDLIKNAPKGEKAPKVSFPSVEMLRKDEEILKGVFSQCPSYDTILNVVSEELSKKIPQENPLDLLQNQCLFVCGVPIKPMLAKPSQSYEELFKRFDKKNFTCEYKYDGERAQIHFSKKNSKNPTSDLPEIKIFSRHLEDNSGKFPDLTNLLPKVLQNPEEVESFVIDCEIVAYDTEKDEIRPFQILSTRSKKNVALESIKVQVCIFAFDLLFYNGQPLLSQTLDERRKKLFEVFAPEKGRFTFAERIDINLQDKIEKKKKDKDIHMNEDEISKSIWSEEEEKIEAFFQQSLKAKCEGLMIKTLTGEGSSYEPSKRSFHWMKLKKDYLNGLGDSLDLVPIGGYFGKGKRAGWYGGFLLASYDDQSDEYQTLCKIGTGFSEEFLAQASEFFTGERITKEPKRYYSFCETLKPDIWFEPSEVWEIKAADLTLSSKHKSGLGLMEDPSKGIGARFPRFIRKREDKQPNEATTGLQIVEMYNNQESMKTGKSSD